VVTVKVNGTVHTTSQKPGSYVALNRRWQSGDVLEVDLPMRIRTEPLPGADETLAVVYGPIVLAGMLGRQGLSPGADIIINERTYGDVLNDPVDVPSLAGGRSKIVERIMPVAGSPLTFNTPVADRPDPLTLIPFFRVAHERYSIYWKVVPEA
jgi:DUF1680 family protein